MPGQQLGQHSKSMPRPAGQRAPYTTIRLLQHTTNNNNLMPNAHARPLGAPGRQSPSQTPSAESPLRRCTMARWPATGAGTAGPARLSPGCRWAARSAGGGRPPPKKINMFGRTGLQMGPVAPEKGGPRRNDSSTTPPPQGRLCRTQRSVERRGGASAPEPAKHTGLNSRRAPTRARRT